jgi:hypothetical protein
MAHPACDLIALTCLGTPPSPVDRGGEERCG